MYQVLYRKYRPKTFSDVSGQQHITATLKNEVKSDRLSHAYLFTGSRGTGKTSCAKILAKAVNCLHPKDGDPCGECELCRGSEAGTVLDIEEIDAASNNGVDYIRALREEVHFAPTAGRFRVYIIDEVHMLSAGAFNALLKTLEEPPEHVIFILATTEVHKVPATVLSRCQRFDFHRISDETIAARLQWVAGQEGFSLDPEAASLIARLADGGLRDALSILDRCAGVDAVTVERVNAVVGLSDDERLFDLADAVADGRVDGVLAVLDELHRESRDMNRVNDQLIAHFRDLMLAKAVSGGGGRIGGTPDRVRRVMNQAERFTLERILTVMTGLQKAAERMRGSVNGRVELEMALIGLLCEEAPADERAVRQPAPPTRKADLSPPPKAAPAALQPVTAPQPETPPAVQEEDAPPPPPEEPRGSEDGLPFFEPWPQVLALLEQRSPMMAAVLNGSDAYRQDDLVLIRSDHSQFLQLIRVPKNRATVRDAITKVTGESYRLGPYKAEDETKSQPDPLQNLVERMQGKVVLHNTDEDSSNTKG